VTKPPNRASVRERKAEAVDTFVKAELARVKALELAKTARLKALRLARDHQEAKLDVSAQNNAPPRKTMHLRRFSR
jgi:hypothetical protein